MTEPKTNDVQKVLSEEILADARVKAEHILKRSQEEAQKAADREVKEAQALCEAILREAREKAERQRQVFRAGLTLEEHRRRVATQGRLIDEVFAKALERLNSRAGFDYRATLVGLAAEAIAMMKGDEFVLRLSRSDLDAMRHDLPGGVAAAVKDRTGRVVNLSVADEPAAIDAGIVIESQPGAAVPHGLERCDSSFAARLKRMQDDLRFVVADMLFGESKEPGAPGAAREGGKP